MKRILFVCTQNIFRSYSAERLLRKLLHDKNDNHFIVYSCGISNMYHTPYTETIERIEYHGGDSNNHTKTIVTQEIIDETDVIICMSQQHKDFIRKHFYRDSYLFNFLAYGTETDLQDDDEAFGAYKDHSQFVKDTVDTIAKGIPLIYNAIKARDL